MTTALIGNAGAFFVAARLSHLGLICAPTFRNVPTVDLLVSKADGSSSASLQVKTAKWAGRNRGGKLVRYEWAMNWTSARLNVPNLFFAFVDLKEFEGLPDVFVIPSAVVFDYYKEGDPATWKWPRYHVDVEAVEPYKNAFNLLTDHLNGLSPQLN